jgi:hypothetical protein
MEVRKSGAIPLLPLWAFMACCRVSVTLPFLPLPFINITFERQGASLPFTILHNLSHSTHLLMFCFVLSCEYCCCLCGPSQLVLTHRVEIFPTFMEPEGSCFRFKPAESSPLCPSLCCYPLEYQCSYH